MPHHSTLPPSRGDRTEHRLTRLFEPRSIALVGASEGKDWSDRINSALRVIGYPGRIHYVNRRGGTAYGESLHRSVADIPETPDLAFLMVPGAVVMDAMRDVAAAGCRAAVVLSSGFAEVGESGRAAQRELAEFAAEHGIVVLGPNALGFVNVGQQVALKPFPPGPALRRGNVALVSQSGNVTVQLLNLARSFDIGLSLAVSTGNEMDVSIGEVLDYLVEREDTTAVAMFAESIQDPEQFLAACRRARAAGKLVVMLKAGRSEAAGRAALAHTGSLVGDDAVIDSFLRSAGVVRVGSLEEMAVVTDTFTRTGEIHTPGLAVLTISGGTCDIVADAAEACGVPVPEFSDETRRRLLEVLPDLATPNNPLDVTGVAVTDPTLLARCLAIVGEDPQVGVVVAVQEFDHQGADLEWGRRSVREVVTAIGDLKTPAFMANTSIRSLADDVRALRRDSGAPYVFGGVDRILAAVRDITIASRVTGVAASHAEPVAGPDGIGEPWHEARSREVMGRYGIPMVPAAHVATAAEAAEAARGWDGPGVVKIVSPDLLHKSDVGGVRLGVAAEDVADVCTRMAESISISNPEATLDGFLVGPTSADGIDLIVGVVRDPDWGNVMAIGLGGIWAEVLGDVQRIALPATPEQFAESVRQLSAWPLLAGHRGTEPVDLSALVEVMGRVQTLALALGEELAAVEINPLRVQGSRVEGLDAVVVWR